MNLKAVSNNFDFVKYLCKSSLNIDAWRISVRIRVTDMHAIYRIYENVLTDFIIY